MDRRTENYFSAFIVLHLMIQQAATSIPTPWGNFQMIAYADSATERMPHLAMVHADFDPQQPTLLRIHSECLTGDLFGSKRCDCGEQLEEAMRRVAAVGGVVIYLRQEGRGIGLINKLKAYNLQDEGLNTVDANTHLGLEIDARQYDLAITILKDLGIKAIHLLTNNPLKVAALESSEIEILSRVPLIIPPQKENLHYLETKEKVMGHMFQIDRKASSKF
ncbi:MAG: GTP cyclohydrolase II [Bacteroidota bacterium]